MKEEKIEKGTIRISPKLIALLLAGGIALTPIAGLAKTDNSYAPGTFLKKAEQVENAKYGIYIVKEGDTASRISEKICSHIRVYITTKYWPVVKYLNPGVLNEGDEIIFPLDPEELEATLKMLNKTGWKARFIKAHHVYPKNTKKNLPYGAVETILAEIYKDTGVTVDPDFVELYLKTTGLDKKYRLTNITKLSNDDYTALTEYIPTVDELNDYKDKPKTKTKKK